MTYFLQAYLCLVSPRSRCVVNIFRDANRLLRGRKTGNARGNAFFTARNLPRSNSLVLSSSSFELIRQRLLSGLLSLRLMNGLHQHPLVLKYVTFALEIHRVVHVFINFFRIAILGQESSQYTVATEPEYLSWKSGFPRTTSFTVTRVATKPLGSLFPRSASSRMDLL